MKSSLIVRHGSSFSSASGSLLNRIRVLFATKSSPDVVAKTTKTTTPPSSAAVALIASASSSKISNITSVSPPTLSTISLMDLVKQINSNHEVLLERVKNLETLVQNSGQTTSSGGDQKATSPVLTESEIEAERLRLTSENIELRKQVDSLVCQLTALEMAVKGADQVAPLSLLPKRHICNKPAQPSATAAATAPTETPAPAASKKQPTLSKEPQAANKENQAPKQQEKKQKQPKQPKGEGGDSKPAKAAPAKPAPEPERAIDGSRLDLRVGKIVDVQKHPDADSLYVERIDCGEESGPRTVVSGLVKHVPIEQMQNRMVIVLCNLKPAKMRGVLSEAMVMCASSPEKVEILLPPEGAVPGDRVTFEKYPGDPDSQLNPKKKIWEQIAPDLSTNDDLLATYKGDPFVVAGKGPVKAETLKKVAVK